jgi:glycosyltransferase involved in cell wall biosynthesis
MGGAIALWMAKLWPERFTQVAALAPHKDQETFLRTIALLHQKDPTLHGVLVGEGSLRSSLEDLAERLGIESSVHFLGFREDPLRYLAAFDVFCLSSKDEGLGTSLLDAMALRIPVAATGVGGIPELIQDGVTGFLSAPRSPEALAQKVEQALRVRSSDPSLLQRAYDHARKYDFLSTVQAYESLYFQVLS